MNSFLRWLARNKALTFCAIVAAGQSAALAEQMHDHAARAAFATLSFAALASVITKLTQDLKGPRQ